MVSSWLDREKTETVAWWSNHIRYLRKNGLVSEQALWMLCVLTQPHNIGDGEGQVRSIRGDNYGRWDVFHHLEGAGLTDHERRILAGVPLGDVITEEYNEVLIRLQERGIDPDVVATDLGTNENGVIGAIEEAVRIRFMAPDEIEKELADLERKLMN